MTLLGKRQTEKILLTAKNPVFSYIKKLGLKSAVKVQGTEWNLHLVNKVDFLLIFEDDVEQYMTGCGSFGPGPFCRGAPEKIAEILSAVANDDINYNKFGSIINNVNHELFAQVSDIHDNSDIQGGLYLTNQASTEPSYFDQMMAIFEDKKSEILQSREGVLLHF